MNSFEDFTLNFHTIFLCSVRRSLVTANVASSSILVTLMLEALLSSETSVLGRATRRNITEEDILPSHRRETLKPCGSLILCKCAFLCQVYPEVAMVSLIPAMEVTGNWG
jgi:hypothetical protein